MVDSLCLPWRPNRAVYQGPADLWCLQEQLWFWRRLTEGHRLVRDAFISPPRVSSCPFLRRIYFFFPILAPRWD